MAANRRDSWPQYLQEEKREEVCKWGTRAHWKEGLILNTALPVPTPFSREKGRLECAEQGPMGAGRLSRHGGPGGPGSLGSPSGASAGAEAQAEGQAATAEAQGKTGGGDHRPAGGAASSPGTHVGGAPSSWVGGRPSATCIPAWA